MVSNWWNIGRQSVDYRWTIGGIAVDVWWAISCVIIGITTESLYLNCFLRIWCTGGCGHSCGQLADNRVDIWWNIGGLSVENWWTINRQFITCVWAIGGQSHRLPMWWFYGVCIFFTHWSVVHAHMISWLADWRFGWLAG